MKKISLIVSILILGAGLLFSQDADSQKLKLKGSPILKIFSNFHTGISEGNDASAFEITRAYLGYEFQISDEFKVLAKLDIGSPEDLSEYSKLRRYAYFKNAYLRYKKGKFTSYFGIINTFQFKLQEKTWGHRYIAKSFQDEYSFGPSADLGWNVVYKMNKYFSADFSLMNGEGYNKLQADNTYKAGMGVTITLFDGLNLRLYYDIMSKDVDETTLASFIGYNYKDIFILGAEYNLKNNTDFKKDHKQNGYSFYASWNFVPKFQVFGRYDFFSSNKLKDEEIPWNLSSDGSALIGGIQYSPIKKVKIAIDYQDWVPYAKNMDSEAFIYLNLEYKL